MIQSELANIVSKVKGTVSPLYLRSLLKEYVQAHILQFIFSQRSYGQKLIFTGGTCLRHFFDLDRLSVDLDFDYSSKIDIDEFKDQLKTHFISNLQSKEISVSLGMSIELRFPLLRSLGLASLRQSDLLLVRVDLSKNPSPYFNTIVSSKSLFGLNFVAEHYDLPSLFAGKLHAILTRRYLKGKGNKLSIKGRDYFDLLWFVKRGVAPNLKRLNDILKASYSLATLEMAVDQKVEEATGKLKHDFASDLSEVLASEISAQEFVRHFAEDYVRHKSKTFSPSFELQVKCQKCSKIFYSGIRLNKETFQTIELSANRHLCPHCSFENRLSGKNSYVLKDTN